MSQKENEEQGEFSLQDLLKNSEQLRRNLDQQQEERDRQDAMETHGLVEPGGKAKKSNSAEVNAMTGQIEHLTSQLQGITAERDDLSIKVSDLTNMLADRDRQISRLGEELELSYERDKVVQADTIDAGKVAETEEPANLSAEKAPKIVHETGEPAKVVEADELPETDAIKPTTKPVPKPKPAAPAKPWAAGKE